MIDDEEKTKELLSKLRNELPIKAYPGQGLIETMKESGDLRDQKKELEIEGVMYNGDEGGIVCALRNLEDSEKTYVVSLTHLKIPREHLLGNEIRAYQKQRRLRLALLEGKGRRWSKKRKNKGFDKSSS